MECENEACPICNGPKGLGKAKILECLHTVCDVCYVFKVGEVGCPLCRKKRDVEAKKSVDLKNK